MKSNEDRGICGPCGGRCCKKMPGGAVPADFGTTERGIKRNVLRRLGTGQWSIDWYDGDPRGYDGDEPVARGPFLRPATAEGVGQLGDPSWGGRCCLLTREGCSLSFHKRPHTCRIVVPHAVEDCVPPEPFGKAELALAWLEYWPWLEGLLGERYWEGTGDQPGGFGLFGLGSSMVYDFDEEETA